MRILISLLLPLLGTAFAVPLTHEEFIAFRDSYLARHENHRLSYVRDYFHYLQGIDASQSAVVSWEEFSRDAEQAEAILLGDYHSNPRSQENVVKVLTAMLERGGPITLVIEWINHEDNSILQSFMSGGISELELKEGVQYERNWPFSWDSHIEILRFCRQHGVRAIAVDHRGIARPPVSIEKRDNLIAQRVAADRIDRPDERYLIVFGSAHVFGQNRPHLFKKLARQGVDIDLSIVITMNSYYFSELEQVLDDDLLPVVRYDQQTYFLGIGLQRQERLDDALI